MQQELAHKLSAAGRDRSKLLELIDELDAEKRQIRDALRKFSNESYGNGGLAGRQRFAKIRRMKAKISHLVEDREFIRQKLGSINDDRKALNRATNQNKPGYCHAFVAAAEKMLPEEQFMELELKALNMLDVK